MRHISNFKKFFEDLSINLTDSPAIKVAKQNYNTDQLNLNEYKAKKDELTKIYTSTNPKDGSLLYDDTSIKAEVDKVLGKEDVNNGKDRNPFLSELLTILDLERRILIMQKSNLDDKLTLDDLKKETEDGGENDQVTSKIKDINDRMSLNTSSIAKLQSDYTKSKKEFDDKMNNIVKDLQDNIKNITSQPKK